MPLKCSLFYVNLQIALAVLGRRMSQTSRRPSASAARLAAVSSRVHASRMLFSKPGDTGLQASLRFMLRHSRCKHGSIAYRNANAGPTNQCRFVSRD